MCEISVIVPVYNVEKYLYRCVNSILAQTFQDFELILIDDGSKDFSGKMCDKIAAEENAKDTEVSIKVLHQKNAGQSAARNRGVEIAKGNYVTFIDSDDYVHPQLLEILYHGIKKHSVPMSMCNPVFRAPLNTPVFHMEDRKDSCLIHINENFFLHLYTSDWETETFKNEVIWGKLYDINILKQYPLEEGRIYEDSAIMCRWFTAAQKVAEYTIIPLYYYVDNPSGTMNAAFSPKKLDKLWSLEQMESLFKENSYHKMLEKTQKLYCFFALSLEKSCQENLALKKKLRAMRRKKVLRNIWKWSGSVKNKFIAFQDYYFTKG